MTKVTIIDSKGLPIPAVIFKGETAIAAADEKGIVNLGEGNYEARVVGFNNQPFQVSGSGEQSVQMKFKEAELGGVEIVAEKTQKKKALRPWVVFIILSSSLSFLIYSLSKK